MVKGPESDKNKKVLSEQLRETLTFASAEDLTPPLTPSSRVGASPMIATRRTGKIAKVSKLFSAVSHAGRTRGDDKEDDDNRDETAPAEVDIFETYVKLMYLSSVH